MVRRTPGHFEYYQDLYPGVNGDTIRDAVAPVNADLSTLGTLAEDLGRDERAILTQTQGAFSASVAINPATSIETITRLTRTSQFALALTREFAGHVDTFDTTVDGINIDYQADVTQRLTDEDVEPADARHAAAQALAGRYTTATTTLDTAADEVALSMSNGPTDDEVRRLLLAGYLPLWSASFYPTVVLTSDERQRAAAASVDLVIDQLDRDGLLRGTPDEMYRRWLENALLQDVSILTIRDVVEEHDIQPDDFDVLEGMEEVRDDTGKSFFVLPEGMSGDDARKAVLMTYVFNARTEYADSGGTEFDEAPYGSTEIQRIIDRQDANSFTYDDDVSFVDVNGGRLATTPNGMLMGLGGNPLQDLYSQAGGSTWGDIFMLNIDDPDDTHATLVDVIESGNQWREGDDGPYEDSSLDLDRLLHHEERHSRQWADEGYLGFITGYANESIDVDWKGWGPFRAPIPHQVEGRDNSYEVDAGLADGGYSE
ncbi:MAG: hypothetical protein PGN07_07045 [Aeromicrobium erythreum]